MAKFLCVITHQDWYTFVDDMEVVSAPDAQAAIEKLRKKRNLTKHEHGVTATPFSDLKVGWTYED